jgi:hypothetical protein
MADDLALHASRNRLRFEAHLPQRGELAQQRWLSAPQRGLCGHFRVRGAGCLWPRDALMLQPVWDVRLALFGWPFLGLHGDLPGGFSFAVGHNPSLSNSHARSMHESGSPHPHQRPKGKARSAGLETRNTARLRRPAAAQLELSRASLTKSAEANLHAPARCG